MLNRANQGLSIDGSNVISFKSEFVDIIERKKTTLNNLIAYTPHTAYTNYENVLIALKIKKPSILTLIWKERGINVLLNSTLKTYNFLSEFLSFASLSVYQEINVNPFFYRSYGCKNVPISFEITKRCPNFIDV